MKKRLLKKRFKLRTGIKRLNLNPKITTVLDDVPGLGVAHVFRLDNSGSASTAVMQISKDFTITGVTFRRQRKSGHLEEERIVHRRIKEW